jgi:hypothetical protein
MGQMNMIPKWLITKKWFELTNLFPKGRLLEFIPKGLNWVKGTLGRSDKT